MHVHLYILHGIMYNYINAASASIVCHLRIYHILYKIDKVACCDKLSQFSHYICVHFIFFITCRLIDFQRIQTFGSSIYGLPILFSIMLTFIVLISNVVHTTHFWDNLHQVTLKTDRLESQII